MRKGVIVILAVAIIGALGIYSKSHSSSGQPTAATPVDQSQNTNPSVMGSDTTGSFQGSLKDGTYTGDSKDTAYGTVQIAIVVSGGKISDVNFLQMPDDRGHTQEVTAFAEPLLKQETIGKQDAHIDFVSGATQTSEGYQESLQSALDMALQA